VDTLRSKFSRASQVRASKAKTFGPSASVRLVTKDSTQALAPSARTPRAISTASGGAAGLGWNSKVSRLMRSRPYLATNFLASRR
jgi:hypothetical protein